MPSQLLKELSETSRLLLISQSKGTMKYQYFLFNLYCQSHQSRLFILGGKVQNVSLNICVYKTAEGSSGSDAFGTSADSGACTCPVVLMGSGSSDLATDMASASACSRSSISVLPTLSVLTKGTKA